MFLKMKLRIALFFCKLGAKLYGPVSRAWRFLFERKYKSMPKTLPWTPEQIMLFFTQCEWVSDGWNGHLDIISKPEKFFETKRGDCDEFAAFAAATIDKEQKHILSVIWYDPETKEYNGHNVCIFKERLIWKHIGNWGLYGPFSSLMPLSDKFKTPNGPLIPSIVPPGCQGIYFAIRDPKTLKFLVGGSLLNTRSNNK